MSRVIAIGDIHGCYHTFLELLQAVDYRSEADRLILLGDYIDRGNFVFQTVQTIRRLQEQVGRERCICLRGNHEQFAIQCGDSQWPIWMENGGDRTVADYERHGADLKKDIAWFASLPLYYEMADFIFCHAGLCHPKLKENSAHDLLWGRDWFSDTEPREKRVVFGHTPFVSVPCFMRTNDIGIDGGCVFGGRLCAMILQENGEFDFISVKKSPKDSEEAQVLG